MSLSIPPAYSGTGATILSCKFERLLSAGSNSKDSSWTQGQVHSSQIDPNVENKDQVDVLVIEKKNATLKTKNVVHKLDIIQTIKNYSITIIEADPYKGVFWRLFFPDKARAQKSYELVRFDTSHIPELGFSVYLYSCN